MDIATISRDIGPAINDTFEEIRDHLDNLGLDDDEASDLISNFLTKFIENIRVIQTIPETSITMLEALASSLAIEED